VKRKNMSPLSVQALTPSTFHISFAAEGESQPSLLNRYGFINEKRPDIKAKQKTTGNRTVVKTGAATLTAETGRSPSLLIKDKDGKTILQGKVIPGEHGIEIDFAVNKNERFYGLGDQTRDRIEQNKTLADMWILNVATYIPIPFLISSAGYGIFVNTTIRHYWDVGKSEKNKLKIFVPGKTLDIYIFRGNNIGEIIGRYAEVTGAPALPPKWSFGLWFICRMQADVVELMSDAQKFRDGNIPCDVIGLEPGWMEKFYDYSTEKKWDDAKFPIPRYAPNGPSNFLNALKRMGYHTELWLCNDYDLTYEAERKIGGQSAAEKEHSSKPLFWQDDTEKDTHFTEPVRLDKLTKVNEPWFEHLKKFVDQGVDFFKQDGALQTCEHPDRLYGNGLTDREMHNLYPLLYVQQMHDGFRQHTGRRACCFTPNGWAGLQRYTGTWTGDTGGGPKTLVACLNLALSGHSLVTCDMDVTTKEGIHYGFLMPWAQVNSWNYFRHPWLQGDALSSLFKDYAQLRSRLIPYLYTYAHVAHTTGMPMMRPLVMEFPHDKNAANLLTEYFLGREFLVTAFAEKIYLPAGTWHDFWTGRRINGPTEFIYTPPENRGGGLFVRANSIIPFGPAKDYVGQKTDDALTLAIFLETGKNAAFTLYDDDGTTFEYEKGKFSLHKFTANFSGGDLRVDIPPKAGVEKIEAYLDEKPAAAFINGKKTEFAWSSPQNKLEIRIR